MPMPSMQLRSLRVRVRGLVGMFLVYLKMSTEGPVRYYSYFMCMRAAESRRPVPATEERIGEGFYTVVKSGFGTRKLDLWCSR